MIFRAITLQEANVFLPLVREHFAKIHALVAEGQLLHDTLSKQPSRQQTLETTDGMQQVAKTEDQLEENYSQKRLEEIEVQIKDEVIELQNYGAIVKSVFPARVDFLSERHRQPVYLCWQMGDKVVSHWHPVDEGFSTRRSISQPQAFGPVVLH